MSEPSIYELLDLTVNTEPRSPEEEFYQYLTNGHAPRIDNMIHFLRGEVQQYHYLRDTGLKLSRQLTKTEVNLEAYMEAMVAYYLKAYYRSRFLYNTDNLPRLDLDKTVKLFMAHEGLRKIISTKLN